jgi:hypothetical protein
MQPAVPTSIDVSCPASEHKKTPARGDVFVLRKVDKYRTFLESWEAMQVIDITDNQKSVVDMERVRGERKSELPREKILSAFLHAVGFAAKSEWGHEMVFSVLDS